MDKLLSKSALSEVLTSSLEKQIKNFNQLNFNDNSKSKIVQKSLEVFEHKMQELKEEQNYNKPEIAKSA